MTETYIGTREVQLYLVVIIPPAFSPHHPNCVPPLPPPPPPAAYHLLEGTPNPSGQLALHWGNTGTLREGD